MKCDLQLLSAYYDGELGAEDRLAVAAHVEACAACAEVLAAYRRASAELRALPRVPVPASLNQRIHAHLEELSERRTRRAAWWGRASGLGLVAAAAVIVVTLSALLRWYDASGLAVMQNASLAPRSPVGQEADVARDTRDHEVQNKAGEGEPSAVPALAAVPAAPMAAPKGGEPARQPMDGAQPGSGTGAAPARTAPATKAAAPAAPPVAATAAAVAGPSAQPAAGAAMPTPVGATAAPPADGARSTAPPGATPPQPTAPAEAAAIASVPLYGDNGSGKAVAANRRALGPLATEPTPVVVAADPTATAGQPSTPAAPDSSGTVGAAAASLPVPEATTTPDQAGPAAVGTKRATGKCVDAPSDDLGRVYAASESVRERLGCAIEGERQVTVTEQAFDRGYMFRRGDTGTVYVLAAESRTWKEYRDGGRKGEKVDPGMATPADAAAPGRHFESLWWGNPEVRDLAGWGLSEERSFGGAVGEFRRGTMLWSDRRVIYVLYSDGTWQDFPDAARAEASP